MRKTNIRNKLWLAALLVALLATLLCLSAGAETYSGECGAEYDFSHLTWLLNTESGELIISGYGDMMNYGDTDFAPWYTYRTFIKKVTVESGVWSIGFDAFRNCTSLTSATIGNSVTSIGNHAFMCCWSLTSVTFLSKTTSIYDWSTTIDSGATIYGYAGSTAGAYASKYDRSFVALEEPADADFILSGNQGRKWRVLAPRDCRAQLAGLCELWL